MTTGLAIKCAALAGTTMLCLSLLPQAARAGDMFNISGAVQIGSNSADFGQSAAGGPFALPSDYGVFTVATPSPTGIFLADGEGGSPATGEIQSLSGTGPVDLGSAFVTFDNPTSHLQLWVTEIFHAALPGPDGFGMFNVQASGASGSNVSWTVRGYVLDTSTNTKVDAFTMLATAQFQSLTPSQLESGLPVEATYSATFVTSPLSTAPAPEPATWALMLAGFGGAGLALRRVRRARRVEGLAA